MWVYIPYYRKVCSKNYQQKILNTIEAKGETKEFANKSGKKIIKHKATINQFGVINVGISKF